MLKPYEDDNSNADWRKGVLSQNTNQPPASTYEPSKAKAGSYQGATYQANTYNPTVMNPDNVSYAKAGTATAHKGKAYDAKSVDAQAHTYNAYKQAVKENELASYHLQKMLDENSDYVKRGKTEGKQYAQSRGILNTTMGAAAAHGAAIDRAAPIATQDAGTYSQRALAHIDAENTARRTNATNKTNVSIRNADAATQVNMGNADRRTSVSVSNADAKNKASIANANNQTSTSQFNAGQTNDFWKQYIDNENKAGQFNANAKNTAGQFNASSENQANQFNALQETNVSLANSGADNEAAKLAITENNQNWRQGQELQFRATEAEADRALERYRIDNVTSTELRNTILNNVGQIVNNPELSTEAKTTAQANIFAAAERVAALSQDLEGLANGTIDPDQYYNGEIETNYTRQDDSEGSSDGSDSQSNSSNVAQRTAENPHPPRTNPWVEWQQRNGLPTNYWLATQG